MTEQEIGERCPQCGYPDGHSSECPNNQKKLSEEEAQGEALDIKDEAHKQAIKNSIENLDDGRAYTGRSGNRGIRTEEYQNAQEITSLRNKLKNIK